MMLRLLRWNVATVATGCALLDVGHDPATAAALAMVLISDTADRLAEP